MKSLLVGKALLLFPLLSSQNSVCFFCNNDGTRDLPGWGFERFYEKVIKVKADAQPSGWPKSGLALMGIRRVTRTKSRR